VVIYADCLFTEAALTAQGTESAGKFATGRTSHACVFILSIDVDFWRPSSGPPRPLAAARHVSSRRLHVTTGPMLQLQDADLITHDYQDSCHATSLLSYTIRSGAQASSRYMYQVYIFVIRAARICRCTAQVDMLGVGNLACLCLVRLIEDNSTTRSSSASLTGEQCTALVCL
jgi:hypothetical protein